MATGRATALLINPVLKEGKPTGAKHRVQVLLTNRNAANTINRNRENAARGTEKTKVM